MPAQNPFSIYKTLYDRQKKKSSPKMRLLRMKNEGTGVFREGRAAGALSSVNALCEPGAMCGTR
jgi:hypothetical protein